jgi:hypothetical protein
MPQRSVRLDGSPGQVRSRRHRFWLGDPNPCHDPRRRSGAECKRPGVFVKESPVPRSPRSNSSRRTAAKGSASPSNVDAEREGQALRRGGSEGGVSDPLERRSSSGPKQPSARHGRVAHDAQGFGGREGWRPPSFRPSSAPPDGPGRQRPSWIAKSPPDDRRPSAPRAEGHRYRGRQSCRCGSPSYGCRGRRRLGPPARVRGDSTRC